MGSSPRVQLTAGMSSSWCSASCRCSSLTATVVSRHLARYTRPKLPSPICFWKRRSEYVICARGQGAQGLGLRKKPKKGLGTWDSG